MTDTPLVSEQSAAKAPYRLAVFWKEDARTKKTFLQYREVQVRNDSGEYEFYPLILSRKLEELMLAWDAIPTMGGALEAKQAAVEQARGYFNEALDSSDNPHCEVFVAQTAMNHLTSLELAFNLIFFADALPLFFDQPTVAKTQQTGTLYLWMDPYLAGLSERNHRPLDTEEANWPIKSEMYCYFKRKSEPTVSPQQLANVWRTSAARVVELDAECRGKLWEWLKGRQFSEEEIRALILP
jgi:hypothetical protein